MIDILHVIIYDNGMKRGSTISEQLKHGRQNLGFQEKRRRDASASSNGDIVAQLGRLFWDHKLTKDDLMKLAAISSRGSCKDFVDLYLILRNGPTLEEYFETLPLK